MRRFFRLVGFVGFLACLGTAAIAQESAKLGPQAAEIEREGITKGDAARPAMYAFAACVLHRHHRQAEQWLSLPADDPTIVSKANAFIDNDCLMNGEIQFQQLLFRGALYAALYRERFGGEVPPLYPMTATVAAGNSAVVHANDMFLAFADCVVHRDPATVRAVVLAPANSSREGQALAALSPQFPLCLVKDSQLSFNKATLTGLLAEALYRESIASLAPATAGVRR